MALQAPFFGKREPDTFGLRQNLVNPQSAPVRQAVSPTPGAVDNPVAESSSLQPSAAATTATPTGGSTLTVGPNIKLKGVEITDCDTLVVEGLVEATMHSRLMQIASAGAFKGSADIDIAEIHGAFDGDLTVRDKLVIYASGKVTGKVHYGKLVIEEGGQLSGDIVFGTGKPAANKPAVQALA